MKFNLIILLSTLITLHVFGQQQDLDFERTFYFELNNRANFREMTNRYVIQDDTIFYSTTGFLIRADWDTATIGDKQYVIITYPDFKKGKQSSSETSRPLGDQPNPVHFPIKNINGKLLCISKDEFERISKTPHYSISFKRPRNYQLSAGQLTLPFKLRPKLDDKAFQMTTDVTLGAYGGIRKRISRTNPTYLTIPFVLGLSFININENSTTSMNPNDTSGSITPGWTWATGFVIQANRVNLGFLLGRDYASGYSEKWIYHNKTWYSFAIGFAFLK